jgi:RimJ/RimL family protein N-acetyltransferase
MLKEKLEFLKGPGGLRAAGYFGLKLLTRIDVFRIVWILAQPDTSLILPPGWRYLSFHTDAALSSVSSDMLERIVEQCGSSPKQLFRRGGSLHLLLTRDSLVAQLSIERGPSCRVDSPPLHLHMAATDAFMGYLYTWPSYRRQGAAQCLIAATVSDLSMQNIHRVIAHVRATNVPSLAAFEHGGWKTGATVLCTLRGRLLMAPGATRTGLTLRSAL